MAPVLYLRPSPPQALALLTYFNHSHLFEARQSLTRDLLRCPAFPDLYSR